MSEPLMFRAPTGSVVLAGLFLVASGLVVYLCCLGISAAEGMHLMVLLISSLFPVLMLTVAGLRLAAIGSRRISLTGPHLMHRQIFKNYTVPFEDIRRIEALRGQDGEIETVKILWSGTPFYVDARAISGFDDFVGGLRRRAVRAEVAEVTDFSAYTGR